MLDFERRPQVDLHEHFHLPDMERDAPPREVAARPRALSSIRPMNPARMPAIGSGLESTVGSLAQSFGVGGAGALNGGTLGSVAQGTSHAAQETTQSQPAEAAHSDPALEFIEGVVGKEQAEDTEPPKHLAEIHRLKAALTSLQRMVASTQAQISHVQTLINRAPSAGHLQSYLALFNSLLQILASLQRQVQTIMKKLAALQG